MANCISCGNEFQSSKYKVNKYCSIACYREQQRAGAYKRGTKRIHTCHYCSSEVAGKSKRRRRNGELVGIIFCNRECYDNYRAEKKKESLDKICANCGDNFIGYHSKSKYCSNECRIDHGYKIVVEKHNVKGLSEDGSRYIKECSVCGNDFYIDKRKTSKSICSKECISEFYKTDEARKLKISKSISGEKHPNYINGSSYNKRIRGEEKKEIFSIKDKNYVFKLFNNRCFKCNSTSDLTIDHHIPFSRGGRLTVANTVLLCRSCNSRKNAKMPEDFYTKKELKSLLTYGIDPNSIFNEYYDSM